MHGAERPGIEQVNVWLGDHRLLPGADTQNAAGQATQGRTINLFGSAEILNDLGDGAALLGVPGILGELVVLDGGAIGILAASGAQVYAWAYWAIFSPGQEAHDEVVCL
jgi:hypothetical protein